MNDTIGTTRTNSPRSAPFGILGLRGIVAALLLLSALGRGQTLERVSVSSAGVPGNGASGEYGISISGDGRYVVYASLASNLVGTDGNATMDVFLRDRQVATTALVSVSTAGAAGNGLSREPSISGDGRYVAFESSATNLTPGSDTNGSSDVFVRDVWIGYTERVSVSSVNAQADFGGGAPAISADGQAVAFVSSATNLVANDTNSNLDVFVRQGQTTERVSVSSAGVEGNGFSYNPAISADGRHVLFSSLASNLVPNDTNGVYDIFLRDRLSGTTERISVATGGSQADDFSDWPSVSADGRFVAFFSRAANLVPDDLNFTHDIFLRDRLNGTTERVSLSSCGLQGNGSSATPVISGDARCVSFYSYSGFFPNDGNGSEDVFLRDRSSGTLAIESLATNGAYGNDTSQPRALSSDGRFVAFLSRASNLVPNDTNGAWDVFVRDRGAASVAASFCAGDGSIALCPCNLQGSPGHGCENSSFTSGAALGASGSASLSADTLQLVTSCEKPTAFSIVLQGSATVAPTSYGDGLRCTGGSLKRLYGVSAANGAVTVPAFGDPSISARSAALGDSIPQGATRAYQVYYRDPNAGFCAAPTGSTFNVSSGLLVTWGG